MLLITGADQYVGFSIVSHLARYEHLRPLTRVLCQNKAPCLNFANKGIDVRQVDYSHPNHLSLAMRGVDHIILAVGNEKDRVANAKHLCQIAAQSGVKSIICISHVGAVSGVHESLQHYALIEEEVINSELQWTIIRPDWIQQNFHLWAALVEKHRHLALPMAENTEICPIDISDICNVVEQLVLDPKEKRLVDSLDNDHIDQVYTLTGPAMINGKQLADSLSEATGYDKMVYRHVRPMDLNYYLNELRKDIWFDARLKQERAQLYRDSFDNDSYRSKAFAIPTATQIQTFVDYFDWVTKTASSICVPHAPMITSMPSRSIDDFFKENANSFKPRV
ncbi:hypothetical protein J3Q64DRAFT_1752650 [Phycomyces blakesleeanus]|uniref:NAD(P)-binding domain-containing protein n=2 Tax=Phycomyces blakesleeanus TaxID=4837 RepID=A0A162U775_PHYB8|nr:hypothetical protein PHYBLDRAFT_169203 [Phycomyces blakesleeanus NRRL 1555(-)]OAD72943.1 hypothetical protein PHYBLDRAFT_169203 [Phycomyces blakesleeanus NRRL 1555(-)]|eukprot:XP_018290983.1 hypothetical protein PHYBLDRAFT_169203 [Phycomyces blakesleeanus NRRL 1555(-)]